MMSERIRELAEQNFYYGIWEGDGIFTGQVDLELFAESIVRECMTMCATVSADYLKHRKGAFDFQDKNIYAEGEAACDILRYKM